MAKPETCPTCGRKLNPAAVVKLCRKCGKVIGRGHKWQFVTEDGKTSVEHRNCTNPESYHPPAEPSGPDSQGDLFNLKGNDNGKAENSNERSGDDENCSRCEADEPIIGGDFDEPPGGYFGDG